jgi:GSH-dependent disulfide-bond oxidoreductase
MHVFVWTTPNGYKPLILLEELGLPHTIVPVNLGQGEQHRPEFLALNPNGRIPALVDDDAGVRVFESGAILIYLAEKEGKLLPAAGQARASVMEWLMFQMSGVGPMIGQLGHFLTAKREDPYPLDRYRGEVERILGVLDGQLGKGDHLAGEYSIADIATYPWIAPLPRYGMPLDRWPNLVRWVGAVGARPAVQRAMAWKPPAPAA